MRIYCKKTHLPKPVHCPYDRTEDLKGGEKRKIKKRIQINKKI